MKLLPPEQVIDDVTMTSVDRILGLHRALEIIHREQIPGDIVECGVWRGGSLIIAKTALDSVDDRRTYWAFDTFAGMTAPTAEDPMPAHLHWQEPLVKALSPLDDVINNFDRYGVLDERVHFVQGDVAETLIRPHGPKKIALLRLDTDWYASTRIELEQLFPLLVPGGIVIIDDYGFWSGCRRAVDEFFGEGFIDKNFEWLDDTGIMYRKPC